MYIAGGIIICIIFDIFRALRKSVKTSDILTYIEDTIFWIIVGAFLIYLIFIVSSGNIRLYSFIGLILGGLLYYFTVSKYFIKISTHVFIFLKKLLTTLLIPLKSILRLNKKIICFICINLQNMTNIFNKIPQITKKQKKHIK